MGVSGNLCGTQMPQMCPSSKRQTMHVKRWLQNSASVLPGKRALLTPTCPKMKWSAKPSTRQRYVRKIQNKIPSKPFPKRSYMSEFSRDEFGTCIFVNLHQWKGKTSIWHISFWRSCRCSSGIWVVVVCVHKRYGCYFSSFCPMRLEFKGKEWETQTFRVKDSQMTKTCDKEVVSQL